MPMPGTLEDALVSVNNLTRIIERIEPALEHMTEALARFERERANLEARLTAAFQWIDELGNTCLYLLEATQHARMGEAMAQAKLAHLRSLVDESELRKQARDRETPPDGIRVSVPPPSWGDE